MSNLDEIDFFTNTDIIPNPVPYYEHLRAKGPVVRLPQFDVVAVVGYKEGVAVFRDDENFSAVNAANGPLPPLPFKPQGLDITDQIEKHRHEVPFGDMIVTQDPPVHSKLKALLMGMITPKRLKENEAAMWRIADRLMDTFLDRGHCEVIADYAHIFTGLVIGDLLGVPVEDYDQLEIIRPTIPGQVGVGGQGNAKDIFQTTYEYFTDRINERRAEPRTDVLTELAGVRYADGSLPQVHDVVKVAGFLFGAAQGTTERLIGTVMRTLGENPDLQQKLRKEPELVVDFVEESLRLEGSTKSDFRLVKKPTKVGDMDVAPGTIVMMLIHAMNRDPRRFENPHEFRLDRRNLREHVAFGRGIHACAGAPLARAETVVSIRRFLDRMSEFHIDEAKHGPKGARRYDFSPTYLLHGLKELHLQFTRA